MKKNIRYKPSKLNSAMTFVIGILFVILGLTVVIPTTFMSGFLPAGIFGLVWTGGSAAITVAHGLYLFGMRDHVDFFGRYEITDEEPEGESSEERLKKLQSLYDQRLITPEEYEEKRKEILREL